MKDLLDTLKTQDYISVNYKDGTLRIQLTGERFYDIEMDYHVDETLEYSLDDNYGENEISVQVNSVVFGDDLKEDYKNINIVRIDELQEFISDNFYLNFI